MICRLAKLSVAVFVAYLAPAGAQTLKKEPDGKQLSCGQKVLVDNQTCPEGQILEVTGSCLSIAPTNETVRTARGVQYHCVKRKRE